MVENARCSRWGCVGVSIARPWVTLVSANRARSADRDSRGLPLVFCARCEHDLATGATVTLSSSYPRLYECLSA